MLRPILIQKSTRIEIFQNKRNFWAWLNVIFNLVDKKRIEEVGPDRACAEWLIRNGGTVTFEGQPPTKDYNLLVSLSAAKRSRLVEVDCSETSITHHGFLHFFGCEYVRSVKFHKCWYLSNRAIQQLNYLNSSLLNLNISSCHSVSDEGVKSIANLKLLKSLSLSDLRVKNWKNCEEILRHSLPACAITIDQSTK